jgi:hypothetical protein
LLDYATQKLKANWEGRANVIEVLYNKFNPSSTPSSSISITTEKPSSSRSLLPQELFIEKEGFFAEGHTIARNLLMVLAFLAIFWILFSNYNLFSFSFMLTVGIFVFTIVAKKDITLKITNAFIFFFIILLFIRLFFEVLGEPVTVTFLGTFPDFSRPDLALLSLFSGILICLGLDRGIAVDKTSFIIGIGGIVVLILFFLTPVFDLLFALIQGT